MRLIKLLVVLIVAAVIALVGYAYLGDMQPEQREVRAPIPLQDGALAPAPTGAQPPADTAPVTNTPVTTTPAEPPATEPAPAPITDEDTSEAPGD